MSIFSRFKKAKKVAEKHKTAATAQVEETKPPPPPHKHFPTRSEQDALAATPTRWDSEESRAGTGAARKTRGEMTASAFYSRANNELNIPPRLTHRANSDLSIDSVMRKPQPQTYQPGSPAKSLAGNHAHDQAQPSNEFHAFSQPRDAPVPRPRIPRPHNGRHATSRISSMIRKKPPPSNRSTEEDNVFFFSSKHSTCSTASSRTSCHCSQSRTKMPSLSMPKFVNHKQQPSMTMEISLPYGSEEELSTATAAIPTWRYEDFVAETEPPTLVKTVSSPHPRKSSIFRSIFHRKRGSLSPH